MKLTQQRGLKLGLTGGMGCGKSTAAGIFRELGFAVLESDEIVRELWAKDDEVRKAAADRWGQRIFNEQGGGINRRKVAEIVFADPRELEWVEGLLHPKARARWEAALSGDPQKNWVVEIPLLFEKGLASEFNHTVCIASSPALQEARLKARGLPPAQIAARQARQWPLREKVERADFTVWNDGTLDFLRRQIVLLAGNLRPKSR